MFLPTYSKIKLCALILGSLVFLIDGFKAGHSGGSRQRRLLALTTGVAGLLYVAMELCWYFYIRFLPSREIALVYYFSWRLWAGVVTSMFLYIIWRKVKVLLIASAALLAAFNLFVIIRHLTRATGLIGIGEGLFGGMFIASLVLVWFDQQHPQANTESTIQPSTAEKGP